MTDPTDILAWYNSQSEFPIDSLDELPVRYARDDDAREYIQQTAPENDFPEIERLKGTLNLCGGWQTIYEIIYDVEPEKYVQTRQRIARLTGLG